MPDVIKLMDADVIKIKAILPSNRGGGGIPAMMHILIQKGDRLIQGGSCRVFWHQ